MSKILNASCSPAGVVTAETVVVPGATVLSEGKQASIGLLFMDADQKTYLPSSSSDIKTSLTKIADALTKISNILTEIGAGMTGSSTAPPPTLATDVTALTTVITAISALKDALK